MSDVIQFDAMISVMRDGDETDEEAAQRILEHMLDADISCSLHRAGSLNQRLSEQGSGRCNACGTSIPDGAEYCGECYI